MKVLRLIPVLDFGGVESRFTLQSREWHDHQIKVEYCCFWKDGVAAQAIRDAGGTVYVLGEDPSVRNPQATAKLLALLKEHRFDIIHASIGEANFHAALCSKLGPWKTIIEETGLPQRRLRNRLVHAALYQLVDQIVAVSQKSADYVLDREWAPRQKVRVINNPARREFFGQSARSYNPNRVVFRAVGRLESVKNLTTLVDAFAAAHQVNPSICLEIYGSGSEHDLIASRIAANSAEAYISLNGFAANISSLHKTTDWLLLPSLSEGFSVAACEALAMGVPVVASAVGGNSEILGPIDSRLLIPSTQVKPWTEAIIDAAEISPKDYEELRGKAHLSAARFHPDAYIGKLAALYTSVG